MRMQHWAALELEPLMRSVSIANGARNGPKHATNELRSKIFQGDLSYEVGSVDGGRFTLVDDTMFLWFRQVRLGHRRNSLEARGQATLVYEVSEVRQALLAQG